MTSTRIYASAVAICAVVMAIAGCGSQGSSAASVSSAALGRDMPIAAHVPTAVAGCPGSPVLLLFHGRGGSEQQWFGGSLLSPGVGVDSIVDRLIASGAITPVTVVSAMIDDSYGVDSGPASDGYSHGQYRRYITDELLPAVIARYATSGSPVFLGGLSMGGYIALDVALDNPGRFAGVGALSPAFFVAPPAERAWMYSANGRPSLFERADAGAADQLRIFLGHGTTDYPWISQSVSRFDDELTTRGAAVSTQTVSGGHDVDTWHALAEPMLRALFPKNQAASTCA